MGGGAAGAATIRAATKVKAAGSDLGAIEHVIFFMQENRSFDHYYGSYKGVRGFDDHPKGSYGAFAQAWPGGAAEHLLPFHLRPTRASASAPTTSTTPGRPSTSAAVRATTPTS
jgi:phospholipase C